MEKRIRRKRRKDEATNDKTKYETYVIVYSSSEMLNKKRGVRQNVKGQNDR